MSTTILGQQPPTDDSVVLGTPQLDMPATGWDTLTERLWLPHPFWIPRGSLRDGPGPEGGLFVVQDMRVTEWLAGRPVVVLTSVGIAVQGERDYKLECTGAGVGEDLSLMAPSTYTIWRKSYPRVSKLWVSLTTPSVYDHVGVPSVPPFTFGIGGANWSAIYVAENNWSASGWMGEARNITRLPGSTACLVTDSWVYDPGEDRDGSNFFTTFN